MNFQYIIKIFLEKDYRILVGYTERKSDNYINHIIINNSYLDIVYLVEILAVSRIRWENISYILKVEIRLLIFLS